MSLSDSIPVQAPPNAPRHQTLLNRLRYKHLLLLVTLDDMRNLHRGAQTMNMSQPAATRMLQEIEQTFDCSLFKRDVRGMAPTASGEVLIEFARNALTRLDRCSEELYRHRLGNRGQLIIGAIMGAAPDLVAAAVIEMKRHSPLLQIRLMGETSDQLNELLAQGRIDIAIARFATSIQHNLFDFEPLGNETMLAVVRHDHPLLTDEQGMPTLAQLLEEWPWILQPVESPARQMLEKEFELAGLVSPRDIIECSSIFAALQLVQRSDAVLAMPESVLRDYLGMGLLAPLPVAIGRTLSPFGLLTRKHETLIEPARQFRHILHQCSRGAGEISGAPNSLSA